MSNPEFQMKGISFVISATTNAGHPLPFKVKLPNGKSAEIQHSLRESFTVVDVINELRLLANNLEKTAGLAPMTIGISDFCPPTDDWPWPGHEFTTAVRGDARWCRKCGASPD